MVEDIRSNVIPFRRCARALGAISFAISMLAPTRVEAQTQSRWNETVRNTFTEDNKRTESEGVTSATACFEGAPPKCTVIAFMDTDAFRKIRIFEPTGSRLYAHAATSGYLGGHIALRDCSPPQYLLRAWHWTRSGDFGLRSAAVLADGELAITIPFESFALTREEFGVGIKEMGRRLATDDDFAALRQVARSSKIAVRLTGKSGYVMVSQQQARSVQSDIKDALLIYDKLYAATKTAPCS